MAPGLSALLVPTELADTTIDQDQSRRPPELGDKGAWGVMSMHVYPLRRRGAPAA
jgi:hypothetical protein